MPELDSLRGVVQDGYGRSYARAAQDDEDQSSGIT
jgi:hypothetical protein